MQIHSFESTTFHSSELLKRLLENKSFLYISLLWSTIKVQRFFFRKTKWRKPQIITKLTPFLKGNPAEHQYLTIFNCWCKNICNLSNRDCWNVQHFLFYMQNRKMPLSKKILYQDFVDFFALLSAAFHLKSFCMSLHSAKRKHKPRTPDSLN